MRSILIPLLPGGCSPPGNGGAGGGGCPKGGVVGECTNLIIPSKVLVLPTTSPRWGTPPS